MALSYSGEDSPALAEGVAEVVRAFPADPFDAYSLAYASLERLTHCDAGYVCEYDPRLLRLSFPFNIDRGFVEAGAVLPLGHGPTSEAIRTGRTVHLRNIREWERFGDVVVYGCGDRTISAIHAPMRGLGDGSVNGVISVQSYAANAFSPRQVTIVEALAALLGALRYATEQSQAVQETHVRWRRDAKRAADEAQRIQDHLLSSPACDRCQPSRLLSACRRLAAMGLDSDADVPSAPSCADALAILTPRELEILNRLPRTNHQIAEDMSLTKRTVQFHLGNAFRKLGVRNRSEAMQILSRSR